MITPGIVSANLWNTNKWLEDKLFTKSMTGQDISLHFIDVADIHTFSPKGQEFMKQMAKTEKLEFFDLVPARKIIMFKWPIVKQYIINYLFIPYCALLLVFSSFTSFLQPKIVNN